MTAPTPKTCEACAAQFGFNPLGDCWCSKRACRLSLPNAGESQSSDCLCPSCLDKPAGLSLERRSL